MANIAISNLRPVGANLFQDSESFMHDLTEQQIADILGGFKLEILWSGFCIEF